MASASADLASSQAAGTYQTFNNYARTGFNSNAGYSLPGADGSVGATIAQLKQAYYFNGQSMTGSGQTIAIVDFYYDPTIYTDLLSFDSYYGIADPPSFKAMAEDGSTNFTGYLTAGSVITVGNQQETINVAETALDVEVAHALAPAANIILVQANYNPSTQNPQQQDANIFEAINTARQQAGVSVVSMSFGRSENASFDPTDNNTLMTPTGHNPVTFVASTGDEGAPGEYPAFSPNVLAVGGTTLTMDSSGDWQSEVTWNDTHPGGTELATGGGVSNGIEPQPGYQSATISSSWRTIPDVSSAADEIINGTLTGVWTRDSADFGATPWIQQWGTSVSAPTWAAIVALADQMRATDYGLSSLSSAQTLGKVYDLNSSQLRDITSGNNNIGNGGYQAGVGYDLTTGRGTPLVFSDVGSLAYVSIEVDKVGFPTGDTVDVVNNGGQTQVTVNGQVMWSLVSGSIDALTVDESGSDSLTLNYTNPIPSITYSAGSGTNSLTVYADANFAQTGSGGSEWLLTGNQPSTISTSNVSSFTMNSEGSDAHQDQIGGWDNTVRMNMGTTDSVNIYMPNGASGSFAAWPNQSYTSGTGYSYDTWGGDSVTAHNFGTGSGAVMSDTSSQSGTYSASAKNAQAGMALGTFTGSGWNLVAYGFPYYTGNSYNSNDVAYLDDNNYSGASATAVVHAHSSSGPEAGFYGTGFDNWAVGFQHEYITSGHSGDTSQVDDQGYTGSGATFLTNYGQVGESTLEGTGFNFSLFGFTTVSTTSYNSADVAELLDMSGNNTLNANGNTATFSYANGTSVNVTSFTTVDASQYYGTDTATQAARNAAYIHLFGTWH